MNSSTKGNGIQGTGGVGWRSLNSYLYRKESSDVVSGWMYLCDFVEVF